MGDEQSVEWRRDDAGQVEIKRPWHAEAIDEVFRLAK
jgi:hypothetical protein